ncbi:hypothetical protein DERF_005379 [Dermatophagoides farinae]|uniref:Uncharacterized protein n=1 Tax=Dermatophagoides farinae TaxID=6954 RepID=A0A922I581_DERFA|nr:hypothetical protein DERF_005379 [Dermatophagoides farinae]
MGYENSSNNFRLLFRLVTTSCIRCISSSNNTSRGYLRRAARAKFLANDLSSIRVIGAIFA